MKPICFPCQRFYRPKKNGFPFVEAMPAVGVDRPEPGTAAPDHWTPYKLWVGDLWECQGCGHQAIVGVAHEPVSEHFRKDFTEWRESMGATFQVNDC